VIFPHFLGGGVNRLLWIQTRRETRKAQTRREAEKAVVQRISPVIFASLARLCSC